MPSPTRSTHALSLLASLTLVVAAAAPHALAQSSLQGWSGRLPLLFEARGADAGPAAPCLARGPGYTVFPTATGLWFVLRAAPRGESEARVWALRTRFVGGIATDVELAEPARTRVHHMRGADPEGWSTDLPTFGRVRLAEVWPGVDVELYDADASLEYDLVVQPGVDPRVIALAFDGVLDVAQEPDGGLRLVTPLGSLRQSAPVAYQTLAGTRVPVPATWAPRPDGSFGFALGAHDPTRPLVIDPVVAFHTYLGGNLTEYTHDVAVDDADCPTVVIVGRSNSVDLPVAAGWQPAKSGYDDAFVARFGANGQSLLWCTYLGGSVGGGAGSKTDTAYAVAIADNGDVVVGGATTSDDFPTTPGAYDTSSPGRDAFVTRLTADGSDLVWSTMLGNGSATGGSENVLGLAIGSNDVVFVTGNCGYGWPVTAGAPQTTVNSAGSGFVTAIAADGGSLVYSTYLGSPQGTSGGTSGQAIAVDASGRAYVAGFTGNGSLPVPNGFDTTQNGFDAFLVRVSADGTAFEYGTYIGGSDIDSSTTAAYSTSGVACLDDGRAWVIDRSYSTDFPVTAGAFQSTNAGKRDAVVICVDTELSGPASLLWATYLGGNQNEDGRDVDVDDEGNAWVTGVTSSWVIPQVDPLPGPKAQINVFVAGFAPDGVPFFCSKYAEPDMNWVTFHSPSLVLDHHGDVYVAGDCWATGLATDGAYQPDNTGNGSAYLFKLGVGTAWLDLGFALAGAAGDPCLHGAGDLTAPGTLTLSLSGGVPSGMACFVLGVTHFATPLKGGVLVPHPDIVLPSQVLDASGALVRQVAWPAGIPSGSAFYGQYWIPDATGPAGWSASNALAVVVP